MSKVLAIIGGGAAGVFAAVNAARLHPELEVVLFEKSQKLLSKVKVSGGGRCNVTHHCTDVPHLLEHYPRGKNFLKKAFYHFNHADTQEWFRSRGVKLKAEADGRMFPVTDDSQTIIDALLQEANQYGVSFRLGRDCTGVEQQDGRWLLQFRDGATFPADAVMLACGGFPKADQFEFIKRMGHTIEPPVPSLFTFNMPDNPVRELMGVSVPKARLKVGGEKLTSEGPLLITHWGMSGPAVLRLSAWGARMLHDRQYHFNLVVNWLPDVETDEVREKLLQMRSNRQQPLVHGKNPFELPRRLWDYLLDKAGTPANCRWAELPSKTQNKLLELLTADVYEVKGKTTFKEEFVTCGGVSLKEINPETMESRICKGLYFGGELMDIDGITGGFNFQNAWTSGWLVAQAQ
jgi:predicted Rossmann fold flavoprotein